MKSGNIVNVCAAAILFVAGTSGALAQATSSSPVVTHASSSAVSPNLSDLPTAQSVQGSQELKITPPPKPLPPRNAGPGGSGHGDGALQDQEGPHLGAQSKTKFGGIGASGYIPPDPNIAVGRTNASGVGYIVQMVNSQLAVFNKSGALLSGPVSLSSLWTGLGGACASSNAGDPIVQYDNLADRWLISELGSSGSAPYAECIAVSTTNDPRGSYYLYSYSFGSSLNDYPKFGVWPTTTNPAYLATYNLFTNGQTFTGAQLCAYDRTAMLSGATSPTAVCFTVANDGNYLPADLDGATPPADGTPGYFLNFETSSSLRLYQLSPNFAVPSSSTLTQVSPDIAVAVFTEACNGGVCIPQPNSQKLDSLGDRLMYRLAYRVFGDHTAMVVNHSVAAGASVGVRWYELRQSAASSPQCSSFTAGAFYLCQQGTYAPDTAYRWMGSAAMDGAGNIAIGYSKSSSSIYPSIAFTGRTPSMTPGTMGAETILQTGKGAQTTYNRWGDYTALRIDPSDDMTFWYTNEYYTSNGLFFNFNWSTAIASFTVGGSSNPPDFSLAVAPNSLTVNRGSSNSTTVTVTALNGSSSVNLSVSGLPRGTTASFSPNPVTATSSGATSTLKISASRNASTGTFIVTVSGNNGSASHGTPLSLIVQ